VATDLIEIDGTNPQPEAIARAVDEIARGRIVGVPTDALYVLVADPLTLQMCSSFCDGAAAAVALSVNCLRQRGCSAQLAAPPRGTKYPLEASIIVGRGLTVRGVVEGDAVPGVFIPRLIDLFSRGLLPVEKLVTFFPFDEINRAIEEMETGAVIKPVLLMQ